MALTIDNASSHGHIETLLTFHSVDVIYLPERTTSRLEPLDAGMIACIKHRYQLILLERAVYLIEDGITERVYAIYLSLALATIYNI